MTILCLSGFELYSRWVSLLRLWRLLTTEPSVTHHRACFREKEKVNDVILGTFPTRWVIQLQVIWCLFDQSFSHHSEIWYTSLFCQIPNKSILSITYSFYLNATTEKGRDYCYTFNCGNTKTKSIIWSFDWILYFLFINGVR